MSEGECLGHVVSVDVAAATAPADGRLTDCVVVSVGGVFAMSLG